jgi:hypothetical protein
VKTAAVSELKARLDDTLAEGCSTRIKGIRRDVLFRRGEIRDGKGNCR